MYCLVAVLFFDASRHTVSAQAGKGDLCAQLLQRGAVCKVPKSKSEISGATVTSTETTITYPATKGKSTTSPAFTFGVVVASTDSKKITCSYSAVDVVECKTSTTASSSTKGKAKSASDTICEAELDSETDWTITQGPSANVLLLKDTDADSESDAYTCTLGSSARGRARAMSAGPLLLLALAVTYVLHMCT